MVIITQYKINVITEKVENMKTNKWNESAIQSE